MKNLGMIYFDKWELDTAMTYYQQSKEIREKLNEQNSSSYAQVLHGIGLIYQTKGKEKETNDYYGKCKQILDSLNMQNTSIYADLMHSYGFMYDVSYHPVEAIEHYNKSREIRDALQLNHSFDYAVLMHDIGHYYLKHQSRPCQAIPYEKMAMQIKEQLGVGDLQEHTTYLADLQKECEEGSPTTPGMDPRFRPVKDILKKEKEADPGSFK
jgi:tetratricopeptide (TPR) repeat protein